MISITSALQSKISICYSSLVKIFTIHIYISDYYNLCINLLSSVYYYSPQRSPQTYHIVSSKENLTLILPISMAHPIILPRHNCVTIITNLSSDGITLIMMSSHHTATAMILFIMPMLFRLLLLPQIHIPTITSSSKLVLIQHYFLLI